MSKARITYRFDQRREEMSPGNVIPLYQEDAGYGTQENETWKSPLNEETYRIERMIRQAETERKPSRVQEDERGIPVYYTADHAEESLEQVPFYEEPALSMPIYRRVRRQRNWFGFASAVAGAILTGVVLGMFVLSMFQGDPSLESEFAPESDWLDPLGNGTTDASAIGDDRAVLKPDLLNVVGSAHVQLPEKTYYFVQNGVFSSENGAVQAASKLKEKGLAGAVENGEKLSVFAGAAEDRDDALLISQQLQNEGLEVYIKPYVLPAVTRLNWSESEAEHLQTYIVKSRDLVDMLISASLQHLSELSPTALPVEQMARLRTDHQEWTKAANQAYATAPEAGQSSIAAMNTSINSAIVTLEQYNKKPSNSYLWQVQTAATEHLIQQKQLLERSE